MVNKRYRFYISFENAICKDYITEKTFNALRSVGRTIRVDKGFLLITQLSSSFLLIQIICLPKEPTNWKNEKKWFFPSCLKPGYCILNTIPIVLGGVNYTAELPPNSYINAAQFITPQGIFKLSLSFKPSVFFQQKNVFLADLADYLYSLLGNESLYLKYFEWRRHYRVHRFFKFLLTLGINCSCPVCETSKYIPSHGYKYG